LWCNNHCVIILAPYVYAAAILVRQAMQLHVPEHLSLPPTFLTRPESITTFVGKSAKFLCTVSGTPVIDVAWQKDGTTISPSDHHKISKVENKHVLEISRLTTSDRGVYTCKASNKFGADICLFFLLLPVTFLRKPFPSCFFGMVD
uniref:Ig-like domain-containing protein n=1 Tax=Bubo bubo TaxID=30461 RepID=A0A8C0FG13_BUBBB